MNDQQLVCLNSSILTLKTKGVLQINVLGFYYLECHISVGEITKKMNLFQSNIRFKLHVLL